MKLGEYQKLKVIKKVEFGVYLAEHEGDETRVLLPQKQVPADAKLGDEIEVFLYKDSLTAPKEPFCLLPVCGSALPDLQ